MTDELKLPRLSRDLFGTEIEARKADNGPLQITFSASSEAPVERYFGTEVLRHDATSIRMQRLNGGAAPLLFNHNWDDPIGMLTGGRVKDGRLVVDARLFDTDRAREVQAMLDGGLRNVSIGYEIHEMTEDKRGTYEAVDWTLLEASIVTVPADFTVGIGRSAEDQVVKPVRITRMESEPAQPATLDKGAIMAEANNAPAGAIADIQVIDNGAPEQRVSATEIEARRQLAIQNICRANKLDSRFESNWVRNGASLEQVADEMIGLMQERDKAATPAMIGAEAKEVESYSLFKVIDAVRRKDWSKAGRERAFHNAAIERTGLTPQTATSVFVPMDVLLRGQQKRDMTAAGVSGSNYIIGTDNLGGSFIDLLRNESVVMGLGATRLSGLVGNVTIPRMTAGNTAYWLADEQTQITESQPTLGQVSLTPKNVAALTEISNQLLRQSDPSVEQMIMGSIARDIGLAADIACLRGTGLNGQPQGIVGTNGVGSFDTDATDPFGDVVAAQVAVGAANALRPGCAYVADLASAKLLMSRSRFANTDTPVWNGSLLNAQMAGFPAIGSNQMAANTMLFGLWPSAMIGEWGVLQIDVDTNFDFTRGHIGVRGWYVMDFAMRYPAAFAYDATVA